MKAEAEVQLIQRCARGDEAAWNRLFDEHYESVFRFLLRQSQEITPPQIEATCQEVFLAAIQNIASFHSRSGLQTWLFRFAMNRGRALLEQSRAARGGATLPPTARPRPRPGHREAAAPPPPPAPTTDDEQFQQLRDALDRLGGPARDLIELHYFGDLSVAALALEFEMGIRSMRARLRKCLKRLEDLVPALTERIGEQQAAEPAAS